MKKIFFSFVFIISVLSGQNSIANTCRESVSNQKLTEYDKRIGEYWATIFRFYSVPTNSNIIEIAPGTRTKVGFGLASVGFQGRLYLVEPNPIVLEKVVKLYKQLLPKAEIIGIPAAMDKAFSLINEKIDVLVANHPLDDMVLGELPLKPEQLEKIFTDSDSDLAFEASRLAWQSMNSTQIESAQEKVFSVWKKWIDEKSPQLTVISQYSSGYFKGKGFNIPDLIAQKLLERMKISWHTRSSQLEKRFVGLGQDPNFWLVVNQESPEISLQQMPGISDRLNPSIMVPNRLSVEKLSQDDFLVSNGSFLPHVRGNDTTEIIHRLLSLQIDAENRDNVTAQGIDSIGWVDRQSDPLDFAMDGNAGSGRAFYIGRYFNQKGGGLTSLGTSKKSTHNSGHQPFRLGVFEFIASNALYSNLRTGTSPAIGLSLKKDAQGNLVFPLSSKIIRKDENGSMDRPSHIYAARIPQSRKELLSMAEAFGKQDAEKFIERILHGAYSMGNISKSGHMLDFETSASTPGRNPTWSLTNRWLGNFFGFEHLGNFDLLRSFIDSSLNPDGVTLSELESTFYQARLNQIKKRFPDLMGASPLRDYHEWEKVKFEVQTLVESFEKLSQLMYANFQLTDANQAFLRPNMVFDFSRFMRLLPLYLRAGKTDMKIMEGLLFTQVGPLRPLSERDGVHPRILNQIANVTVKSEKELEDYKSEARDFIKKYIELYKKVSANDTSGFEARALLVNEDRIYLGYEGRQLITMIENKLANKQMSPQDFAKVIEWMTKASDRLPKSNVLIAKVKVEPKGVQFILIRGQSHVQVKMVWGQKPIISEWKDNLTLIP